MARILSAKEFVLEREPRIAERVEYCVAHSVVPTLALVRVGERPDDMSYERSVEKRAAKLGIATRRYTLAESCTQEMLASTIAAINIDQTVHGCLMFRPLPAHIDEKAICDVLIPEKDIDGMSTRSLASVFMGEGSGFPPCTAEACLELLSYYNIPIEGKHIVTIGRSLVIGRPVAMMGLNRNASVTILHSRTQNLADICQSADIVICATGRPRAFGAENFRAGQVVLDVGINFDESGALCGDVDFDVVEPIVDAITPVPGGIGSVTTTVTLDHVVSSAERAMREMFA